MYLGEAMIYRLLIVGLLLMGGFTASAQGQETETRTIFVAPTLADCMGMTPQKCYQVKDSADADYALSSIPIEGFKFEVGFVYELEIEVTPVENPPADAPSETWRLLEVVNTERAREGNLWGLDSYVNADGDSVDALDALAGSEVTLEFIGDRFVGDAGCNSYGGSYSVDGESLEMSGAVSTMMACADDDVMSQETAFLSALSGVASYQIADDQLQLLNADGATVVTFNVVEPAPLVGTNWVMTSYNEGERGLVSALEGVDVTIMFDEAGQAAGSAGCNSYGASYTAGMGMMRIGGAASTLMACADEGVMTQEQGYVGALEGVAFYTIRGDTLELQNADGDTLINFQADGENGV
jgi:heat shock protein HslJ